VRYEIGRQDLDCHFTVERFVVRAIDLAHAADAEQRPDCVGAQLLAHQRAFRAIADGGSCEYHGGHAHESFGARCSGNQRFDFTPQFFVTRARAYDKFRALPIGKSQRSMAEILDLLPSFRRHDVPPSSSRSSQSFAMFQSRLTVSRET
jgi:hypothetical protein